MEEQLWMIFTFYSVRGNPLEPDFLTKQQFVKFCNDCRIVRAPVMRADCEVLYARIASQKRRNIEHRKMTFPDFAEALLSLSTKLYRGVEDTQAFARLIREDVLPRARRRAVEDIDDFLADDDTVAMLHYTGPSLDLIFQYYASQLDNDVARPREEGIEDAASVASFATSAVSAAAAGWRGSANQMKLMMGHRGFMKLTADFHVADLLPAWDISDKYLSACKQIGSDRAPKIGFEDFWECVCRLALSAYAKANVLRRNKLRALLLHMAHHVSHSWTNRGGSSGSRDATDTHDLMQGMMDFQKRVDAMWARDGHRDYLAPVERRRQSAVNLLAGMSLAEGADGVGTGKTPMEAWRHLAADPAPSPLPSRRQSLDEDAQEGGAGAPPSPAAGAASPPKPSTLDTSFHVQSAGRAGAPGVSPAASRTASARSARSARSFRQSPAAQEGEERAGAGGSPNPSGLLRTVSARGRRLRRDSVSLMALPSCASDDPGSGSKPSPLPRHLSNRGSFRASPRAGSPAAAAAAAAAAASPSTASTSASPARPPAGPAPERGSPVGSAPRLGTPPTPPPPPPPPTADDDLDNWIAAVDPSSGKRYYYHRETRETRWSLPL